MGAYFIVHWYAYSTYYLGNDAGTVAVYQGQPGGVLWFKPVKVFDTNYQVSTLARTIGPPIEADRFPSRRSRTAEDTRRRSVLSIDELPRDHDADHHVHDHHHAEEGLIGVATSSHPGHDPPRALRRHRRPVGEHPVLSGAGTERESEQSAQHQPVRELSAR